MKKGTKPRQESRRVSGVANGSFLGLSMAGAQGPVSNQAQQQGQHAGGPIHLVAAGEQVYLQQVGQTLHHVQPQQEVQQVQPNQMLQQQQKNYNIE